jgi:photosystem II stability/assembly factor-like uncharacterized protein
MPEHETMLLSPGGTSIGRGDHACAAMAVGTTDGVWCLRRGPDEWGLRNKGLAGTFVSALTQLDNGALIAGTHGFGLSRSVDGGLSWHYINKGIRQFDVWTVKALRLNGRERLFAGTMPAHLFVSDDGGDSWSEVTALGEVETAPQWAFPPPPHQGHVKEIVAHQGKTLLVGIEVGALLRSTDDARSFEELAFDQDLTEIDIHRLIVHPNRPKRLIAVTGWGVRVSEDSGATWRHMDVPGINYPDPMVMHPDDPDLLFVSGASGYPPNWYKINRAKPKIARSVDGGKSWERLLGGLPDGQRAVFGAMTLYAWDGGYSVLAGDTDGQIFESLDGGHSWHVAFETAPMSKGEQYRGLVKHRPPTVDLDALAVSGPGAGRMRDGKA